jgi:23S rRNA-/tRNA-specific pseudouridylate synthase
LIDIPLAKQTFKAGWRTVGNVGGQAAVTAWRVCGASYGLSWLELRPRTGRTHQIRAHCAALGCPVLGDAVYGTAGGALHLLSHAIRLPVDPPVAATARPPPHMRAALASCGWSDQ